MRLKYLLASVGLMLLGQLGLANAEELVGTAQCVECHDSEDMRDMSRSAHGFAADKRAPDCITCHGQSKAHLVKAPGAERYPTPDRIFSKKSALSGSALSEVCLTCHVKDAKQVLWSGSQHQGADVACSACHQTHINRDKVLRKTTQTEVCYTCHKEQRAQLNKPSHHPVPEGKMTCADCHNVHGSAGPKLVKRDSINATCYTCHAEKRGPFVQQHDPVAEDCSSCHNSHGTMVASLLKVRAPLLCQQCHSTSHLGSTIGVAPGGVPSINAVGMWQGRSCTNCHTQVHGSNNPSSTGFTPKSLMR
jgi:DmsE family decaheme c-type cytochrome